MKIYCIGISKEDKGRQLEWLTQAILHNQGGEDVICNAVGTGGNEIDVSARLRHPLMSETIVIPVICECKAHKDPIGMDDWQKFIGKTTIKARENSRTLGIMISPDTKIIKIRLPELVVHRIPVIDEIHSNYFIEGITHGFMKDYADNVYKLSELHTDVQGIIEVGFSSLLTVKTSDGKHFEYPSSQKYSLV